MKDHSNIVFAVLALAFCGIVVAMMIASCMTEDFAHIRLKLRPLTSDPKSDYVAKEQENTFSDESRDTVLNASRARSYFMSAMQDYYAGNYDDALERLERAKCHDPTNFNIFRLSGQIFFEQARYRKAFNDLVHATQLPNDDQLLLRDIDVLKRLLRYSRLEIDRLQKMVNHNPNDRIAMAKLRDIEKQLME